MWIHGNRDSLSYNRIWNNWIDECQQPNRITKVTKEYYINLNMLRKIAKIKERASKLKQVDTSGLVAYKHLTLE